MKKSRNKKKNCRTNLNSPEDRRSRIEEPAEFLLARELGHLIGKHLAKDLTAQTPRSEKDPP